MSNNYTDDKAKNIHKKDSRLKIATDIKNKGKHKKIVHYLGGQNPWTPFENFFNKGSRTTFIRYEFKSDTELPDNYLDEKSFDHSNSIEPLMEFAQNNNKLQLLEDLQQIKKEIDTKYGCFVNDDVFDKYGKYVDMFSEDPHYYWLDFCCAPSPEVIQKVMDIVQHNLTKDVYVTFYMNHRGNEVIKNIITQCGKSLKNRSLSLKKYCESILPEKTDIICEVFDNYNNGKAPMTVLKITKKEKIIPKKSVEEYLEASKRFSNKQLCVLWKMPTMRIAGLAAAAKRKQNSLNKNVDPVDILVV